LWKGEYLWVREGTFYIHTARKRLADYKHYIRGLTYINHHSLLAELVQRHRGVNSTPIELDRAANAVDTAPQYDDAVVVECHIVGTRVVRRVEVVGISGELRRKRVNFLDPRPDAEALPASSNLVLGAVDSLRDPAGY
jgi:hypothetical protein